MSAEPYSLRCHRCSAWLGEASAPMEIIGLFKSPRDVGKTRTKRRDTWRCKGCGWANVFQRGSTVDTRAVTA